MSKSKKGGRLSRRRSALELLEKKYAEFKAAGKDKEPRDTAKNSRHPKHHAGVSFAAECKRMENEIHTLKSRINGGN